MSQTVTLHLGNCLDWLPTLPEGSVDCVVTDPPYPEINRPYGRWTEAEWHDLMRGVVRECRRILKPSGSAVFILQPNSERVGRMRLWLWEFMVWAGREWGIVQDVWWWNTATLPQACTIAGKLCRPSLKACVWLGCADCYRNQDAVLWDESQANTTARLTRRAVRVVHPSGHSVNGYAASAKAAERGGVTPFNVLPIPNTASVNSAGANGHGAGTPAALANWWLRYICPPGGTACDPFLGSGTTGIEAVKLGLSFVGGERMPEYHAIASRRIAEAQAATPLFASQ